MQCGLAPEQRALERWAYFNATDRIIVGYCPDEPGYAAAKERYIDAPQRIHGAYWEGILNGDRNAIIKAVTKFGGDRSEVFGVDENDCVIRESGYRLCPPLTQSPRTDSDEDDDVPK